jgi:hypothetical protein
MVIKKNGMIKRVKVRKDEVEPKREKIDRDDNQSFDNQFEVLSSLTKVKCSLKKNVTEDYTLAMLGEPQKEFITENYENAEFAKELIKRYGAKGYRYKWNESLMKWEMNENNMPKRFKLKEDEVKQIEGNSNRVFEFFMIQPHMISVLNRNRADNFLVRTLGNVQEDERPVQFEADDRSALQKIKDQLSNRGENEGES